MKSVYYYFLRQWNKTLDWFYSKFFNPYNVKPYGYCPVQADGNLPGGEYYYFRSRHTTWSVRIAKCEESIWNDNAWVYSETKYDGFSGGWISKAEVIRNFNKAMKLYRKK